MFRTITSSAACALVVAAAAQGSATGSSGHATINFATASWLIDAKAEARISELCARIAADAPERVVLMGHTDARGSLQYNIGLSQRRTEAVRAALQACAPGVAFELAWQGEQAPLLQASESDDVLANRRVEVEWERLDAAAMVTPEGPVHGHAHVRPLMPMADTPREFRTVDPTQPICFTASDGVTVRIAANSIVHADGAIATGPVEISYRSFLDPLAIIASGIPMHVQTEAGMQHFETAGMYEVYAAQEGEKLGLKPGTSIELERREQAPLAEGFGPYELSADNGAWATGGALTNTVVPVNMTSTLRPMTPAVQMFLRRADDDLHRLEPDSTSFDARRSAWNYCYVTQWDSGDVSRRSWEKVNNPYRRLAGIPAIQLHPGPVQHFNRTGEVLFSVLYADNKYHPELRHLRSKTWWKYAGNEPRAVFKQLYGRRHWYQDIELIAEAGSDSALLRVKEAGRWLELPVEVGVSTMSAHDRERWERDLAKYNTTAANKRKRFDHNTALAHNRWSKRRERGIQRAWEAARPRMNSSEDSMSRDAFRTYAVGFRSRFQTIDSLQQAAFANISTRFSLDGFGVYNIDRIMKMPEQLQVVASTGPDGAAAFPWLHAYAVLNGENSVITYWGNGTGLNDGMLVAPGRMKSLFLVDGDGRIALAEVDALNSGNVRCALPWRLLDQPASLEELRALASE